MNINLLLDNKDGLVWDLSDICTNIKYSTNRIGKPSNLTFTLIKGGIFQSDLFKYNSGDIIRLQINQQNVFYGYVFKIQEGKNEDITITCYDQIRYLLNQDTYVFANITASEVINRIARDFKLKIGTVEDTNYVIPKMIADGETLLDIIDKALTFTIINTGNVYMLYDDFGLLSLRNVRNIVYPIYLGDDSLIYDYKKSTSIDENTYNRVILYKDNKKKGSREIFQAQDSSNIAKWGLLQLYQSVDENLNAGQVNRMLNQLIQLKNRETKSLKLECIGDISIRAGGFINVVLDEYGINQPFLIEECIHNITDTDHTMSLNLRVVD